MNVEHLRGVIDAIAADHQKQRPVKILQRIGDAYTQTFQSPSPETAKAYEDIEEELKTAITQGQCVSLPPSGMAILERLDALSLCGDGLLRRLREIIQSTETPAAKVTQLQQLHQRVENFAQIAIAMRDAMQAVNIQARPIPADVAEIEIRLPTAFIKDSLRVFAKESERLDRALLDVVECASSARPPLKLRSLSSGSVEIFVTIDPQSGAAIASLITALLVLVDRIFQLRKNRSSYEKQEAPPDLLKRLEALENEERDKELDRLAKNILAKITDEHRRNELNDSVNKSVRYLADRLDKGMEVTVAVLPSAVPEEEPAPDGKGRISVERANWVIAQTMKEGRQIERQSRPVLALPPSDEDTGASPTEPEPPKEPDGGG